MREFGIKIADKIANMIGTKKFIALAMTGTIVYLGVTGQLDAGKLYEAFLIILGYYFGFANGEINGKKEN